MNLDKPIQNVGVVSPWVDIQYQRWATLKKQAISAYPCDLALRHVAGDGANKGVGQDH